MSKRNRKKLDLPSSDEILKDLFSTIKTTPIKLENKSQNSKNKIPKSKKSKKLKKLQIPTNIKIKSEPISESDHEIDNLLQEVTGAYKNIKEKKKLKKANKKVKNSKLHRKFKNKSISRSAGERRVSITVANIKSESLSRSSPEEGELLPELDSKQRLKSIVDRVKSEPNFETKVKCEPSFDRRYEDVSRSFSREPSDERRIKREPSFERIHQRRSTVEHRKYCEGSDLDERFEPELNFEGRHVYEPISARSGHKRKIKRKLSAESQSSPEQLFDRRIKKEPSFERRYESGESLERKHRALSFERQIKGEPSFEQFTEELDFEREPHFEQRAKREPSLERRIRRNRSLDRRDKRQPSVERRISREPSFERERSYEHHQPNLIRSQINLVIKEKTRSDQTEFNSDLRRGRPHPIDERLRNRRHSEERYQEFNSIDRYSPEERYKGDPRSRYRSSDSQDRNFKEYRCSDERYSSVERYRIDYKARRHYSEEEGEEVQLKRKRHHSSEERHIQGRPNPRFVNEVRVASRRDRHPSKERYFDPKRIRYPSEDRYRGPAPHRERCSSSEEKRRGKRKELYSNKIEKYKTDFKSHFDQTKEPEVYDQKKQLNELRLKEIEKAKELERKNKRLEILASKGEKYFEKLGKQSKKRTDSDDNPKEKAKENDKYSNLKRKVTKIKPPTKNKSFRKTEKSSEAEVPKWKGVTQELNPQALDTGPPPIGDNQPRDPKGNEEKSNETHSKRTNAESSTVNNSVESRSEHLEPSTESSEKIQENSTKNTECIASEIDKKAFEETGNIESPVNLTDKPSQSLEEKPPEQDLKEQLNSTFETGEEKKHKNISNSGENIPNTEAQIKEVNTANITVQENCTVDQPNRVVNEANIEVDQFSKETHETDAAPVSNSTLTKVCESTEELITNSNIVKERTEVENKINELETDKEKGTLTNIKNKVEIRKGVKNRISSEQTRESENTDKLKDKQDSDSDPFTDSDNSADGETGDENKDPEEKEKEDHVILEAKKLREFVKKIDESGIMTKSDKDANGKSDKDKKKREKSSKSSSKKSKHSKKSRSRSPEKSKKKKKSYSRSPSRHRRSKRSRSRSRSHRHSRSRSRSRSHSRRSRSRSRHHHSKRSKSRRSRSRSRDRRLRSESFIPWSKFKSSRRYKGGSPDCIDYLRDKATRRKLLSIARKNAAYLMQNNCLPQDVANENSHLTNKSVDDLTKFCRRLVEKDYSDSDSLSDPEPYDRDNNITRHPFSVSDKPIYMNIRNAPMIPIKSNAERIADQTKIFPVSCGTHHRTAAKDEEWVEVKKDEEKKKVFPDKPARPEVDLSTLVSNRINAMRKLQTNPTDTGAKKELNKTQEIMHDWALSKQGTPGAFTGRTGAKVMSRDELCSGPQTWVHKDQLKCTKPVDSHFGLKMLQKMGWKPGEGLGKNKEGATTPLELEVKNDKKGLSSIIDVPKHLQMNKGRDPPAPVSNAPKNFGGKHPISALMDVCIRRRWNAPSFQLVMDTGPDHKKYFLFSVTVNNETYRPTVSSKTKKLAKANSAAVALEALGISKNKNKGPGPPMKKPSYTQQLLNTTGNAQPQFGGPMTPHMDMTANDGFKVPALPGPGRRITPCSAARAVGHTYLQNADGSFSYAHPIIDEDDGSNLNMVPPPSPVPAPNPLINPTAYGYGQIEPEDEGLKVELNNFLSSMKNK